MIDFLNKGTGITGNYSSTLPSEKIEKRRSGKLSEDVYTTPLHTNRISNYSNPIIYHICLRLQLKKCLKGLQFSRAARTVSAWLAK